MLQLQSMFSSPFLRDRRRVEAGSKPNQPRFGCRMEGIMLADKTPQRDEFVKSVTDALPHMAKAEKNPTQSVNPSASLLGKEQGDGWGFAFFTDTPNGLQHRVSPRNVVGDPVYTSATQAIPYDKVTAGLTHVRFATDITGPKAENTHPFRLDMDGTHWTFVHNGRWNQSLMDSVKSQLKADPAFQPKGDTDSEHAFLYLMRSIRRQLGTLNSQTTGQEAMKRAFASGIRQLTKENADPFYADIPESGLGISGQIQMGPSHNFIASDGQMMLAYKHGQSLYLGVQLDAKGRPAAHLIATVPRTSPNLRWFDIQDNTIITISRDEKTGQSKAELAPLDTIPE